MHSHSGCLCDPCSICENRVHFLTGTGDIAHSVSSAMEGNSKGAVYQSGGVILSVCCTIVAREVVSG